MERHSRGKGKQRLLGSHQKCWIWGRNAVLETLRAGRWPILELFLAADLPPAEMTTARSLATAAGTPEPLVAPPDDLVRRCHSSEHQGYLARMSDYPYAAWSDVCAGIAGVSAPLVLVLDSLQDPYNFGAILRSAEVFGCAAVVLAEQGQVGVTSMVARSSAGAVNRLRIARVPDVAVAIHELQALRLRVYGASEKAEVSVMATDLRGGTALVIGNEGHGMSEPIARACDALIRIPQQGGIGSLNAAIAASILLYEVQRQRTPATA